MGSGIPHRSHIHATAKGGRRVPLHEHPRTDDYLRCLAEGAAIADPGDLDYVTECELWRQTMEGTLKCEHSHGRRIWKKT